jgi:hypothetical protein
LVGDGGFWVNVSAVVNDHCCTPAKEWLLVYITSFHFSGRAYLLLLIRELFFVGLVVMSSAACYSQPYISSLRTVQTLKDTLWLFWPTSPAAIFSRRAYLLLMLLIRVLFFVGSVVMSSAACYSQPYISLLQTMQTLKDTLLWSFWPTAMCIILAGV